MFFLPAIIVLGVVSTLQDFRARRISNLWIIISLVYAIMAHLYLFASGDQQETLWFLRSFVNVLASAIVAIYFWKQNWWGGGDAKLFVCYSALVPLSHYPFGYFSYYFASFLLLITTFIPAAIWTYLHAQINLIKGEKGIYYNSPKRVFDGREFLQFSAGFTAIFFLLNLLILILNQYFYWLKDFPIIVWLFSIGFYNTVFRLFKKRLWLVVVLWILGICSVVFVPFFGQINVWRVLINNFIFFMLIVILRKHMFRTIENYVEWSKNNNMAFAGWMFLGVLVIWFSKTAPWLMRLFYKEI
jgi:Flp pilus assembly protein protease CpaA